MYNGQNNGSPECSQSNGHVNGTVYRAGVSHSFFKPVVAEFRDVDNGRQVKKLQSGYQVIGSVTVEQLEQKFQILVQSPTGRQFRPMVSSSDSVLHLKQMVATEWGIPTNQQKLVYDSKNLQDYKTLGESKIKAEAKVYLVTQLRGG